MARSINDAWLKVLEERVAELQQKEQTHKKEVSRVIARFRNWAATADEFDIYYDVEYRAKDVASVRETYKAVWHELKKAEAELEEYKETIGK